MGKVLFLIIVFSVCGKSLADETTLASLLESYRQQGFHFIFSEQVVDLDERLEVTDTASSIKVLEAYLKPLGYTLRSARRKTWIILAATLDNEVGSIESAIPDIETVIVTASLHELKGRQNTSYDSLSASQLEQTPSFGGDSIRLIHRLPGAATIGISSKPNVRGGNENELLVVFDGVELIDPFHLRDFQSLFSTFNPRTIQNIDYFTGGFPSEYGNKMSGVMDIATQESFESGGGELGISTFTTSALIFGDVEDYQWLVSARRGNLDLLLDRVNSNIGKPSYFDIYAKLSRQIGRNELSISAIVFEDDIRFTSKEELATSDISNRYLWSKYKFYLSENWYGESQFSIGQVDSSRMGTVDIEDTVEGSLSDMQEINSLSFKQLLEWRISKKAKATFGFSFNRIDMKYDTEVSVEKGTVTEVLNLPTMQDFQFRQAFKGNKTGLHGSFRYQILKLLTIEAGLRIDHQSYGSEGSETQISPRISAIYTATDKLSLRASYGQFYQPQSLFELDTTDGEVNFEKSQKSAHWIAAVEYQLSSNHKLGLEVYYKDFSRLKTRYENLFNPYVFLPELASDRFSIKSEKAFAKGIEMSYSGFSDSLDWSLNYSYSKTQDKVDDQWTFRRWDQPHTLNGLTNWHKGNFNLGLAAAWHTGWRFTALPDDLNEIIGQNISTYRNKNKLRDFATVDFRLSYEFELQNSKLQTFIEVTNIVNRRNEGGTEYEIEEEDGEFKIDEVDLEPIFPLVTTIGFTWQF